MRLIKFAMRSALTCCLVGAALFGSGCDDEADRTARILVSEQRVSDAVLYVEGAVGFVRIERPDGTLVAQGMRGAGEAIGTRPVLDARLPPGLYRVVSYQQTCSPACPTRFDPRLLDPFRSQECQRPVPLKPDTTTRLVSKLGRDARRCRFG